MKSNIETQRRIEAAVRAYTGWHNVRVVVIPDPRVPGVYAVQATQQGQEDTTVQFLFDTNAAAVQQAIRQYEDWMILEEVEFTSWPPREVTAGRAPCLWSVRW